MKLSWLFTSLLIFILSIPAIAQDTTSGPDSSKKQLYIITKTDGAEFYGYILKDDGREILLETKKIGHIYINKSDISEIKKFDGIALKGSDLGVYKDFRVSGPFTTRYYFTTNALPIKKKENYAMINLFGPEAHFSITDNLSLGVMASWIASPIALAGKYSFNSKSNTHFAIGSIVGTSGYLMNSRLYGGLHWITVTQGNRMSNVSLSVGYAYADVDDLFGADYGSKHLFNSGSSGKYAVGYTGAYQAISQKLYTNEYDYNERYLVREGIRPSTVVSVAGITPIGKKASLILDGMAFIGNDYEAVYQDMDITVTYQQSAGNTVTETHVIGEGRIVASGNRATVILMPSMRFNQSHNKAFQVSLAGVLNFNNSDAFSFPMPMVSWFRQF
jgi:hypothetical protein